MELTLNFDSENRVEPLTLVLAKKSGSKIGLLNNVSNIRMRDSIEGPEISFTVSKLNGENIASYWNELTSFKLIWVKEANAWFEAVVELAQGSNGVEKQVTLTSLGIAELSNTNVYGLEINTESDIQRDDYSPTVFYNPEDTAHSLVHRILSYAPHYVVGHVDDTLKNIQRTFSFNDTSIKDSFDNVAEELSIYVDYTVTSDSQGRIVRSINFYDMLKTCTECGRRYKVGYVCPDCGNETVYDGFGDDTMICVSSEDLGSDITIGNNVDDIKNCYHLSGGDDLMTAAIRQCNPNGTAYIWYFTDEMLRDMSPELTQKVHDYNDTNEYYNRTFSPALPSTQRIRYNELVDIFMDMLDAKIEMIRDVYDIEDTDEFLFHVDKVQSLTGYAEIIRAYYDAIDFELYLKDALMPSVSTDGVTAQTVASALADSDSMSELSVGSTSAITLTAANSAVLNMAKLIANPAYKISVKESVLESNTTWSGVLSIVNWYDENDAADVSLAVEFTEDYENYVHNKIAQTLYNQSKAARGIVAMLNQMPWELSDTIIHYSLTELNNTNQAFEAALGILENIGSDGFSEGSYDLLYNDLMDKKNIITEELSLRESDVNTVVEWENILWNIISNIQTNLNPATFFEDEYIELNAFRREESYSDSNFISDGLTNAELIKRAYEFITNANVDIASKNIYSYEINSTLRNLLLIPAFAPLWNKFKIGNWLRVKNDDDDIYKLRLTEYEIDFDSLDSISVSFADVSKVGNISTIQSTFAMQSNLIKANSQMLNKTNNKFEAMANTTALDLDMSSYYSDRSIELVSDKIRTAFNVLEGLIEGSITSDEAYSIIRQELNKITLEVSNGDRTSTVQLKYDGINLTSDQIELSGNVVFKSNLVDGTTQISGDNITTGQIVSANYRFNDGSVFSDEGTLLDLINGNIQTPSFFMDSENGVAWLKDVHMESGWIGDSELLTADDGAMMSDKSKSSWKLRTAGLNDETYTFYGDGSTDVFLIDRRNSTPEHPSTAPIEVRSVKINGSSMVPDYHYTWEQVPDNPWYNIIFTNAPQLGDVITVLVKERYYTYMTKNKHLVVSNNVDEAHDIDVETGNDVTDECTVGMRSCPWKAGYFKEKVSINGADAITTATVHRYATSGALARGELVTLRVGDWEDNEQEISVEGISSDETTQLIYATPSIENQDLYYRHKCQLAAQSQDALTFACDSTPDSDVDVYVVVMDFSQRSNIRYEDVVLKASDWVSGEQTITDIPGISDDETLQLLQTYPYASSTNEYNDCGIILQSQGFESVTWKATYGTPSANLQVRLAIIEVEGIQGGAT